MTVVDGIPAGMTELEAQLIGPGGFFEVGSEVVGGETMTVFAGRLPSLRAALEASTAFGDREYVIFADREQRRVITHAEHLRAVASVAKVLREDYGVVPGDRVAILAANCPEWIVTFWATVSLGAIAVGLNGWWVGDEIRYGISDCDPKVLVADRKRLERLGGEDPGVPTIVIEDDFDRIWHAHPDAELPSQPIAEDDPALILYTSGTTGRPKGAVNTHRNVIGAVGMSFFHGARMAMLNPGPPDAPPVCQLVTYPLFHVSGLHMGAIAFMLSGIRSVWTMGRFDEELVMELIQNEGITGWSYTVTMLHRVVSHPRLSEYDLSGLRNGGGGGSAFSPALLEKARTAIPNLRGVMGVGYGQTECAALATINAGEELVAFPDAAGRPLPTIEIEIRDEDGDALPDGEDGEIFLRGPMVMPGYWRRPEETAATISAGGWLRTGDIGRMEGGRLYLATRKRDLILRGGENVYPIEIENRLEAHPGVGEVAVIPVDHEALGHEVKAVVVPLLGVELDPTELAAFCGETLAYFKVPSIWEVRREPLPRNATGKVVKAVLMNDAELQFAEE
ncbi:MAG: acyl--CoA ligase [Acidimicrobiia bacterium]|nr:acyl--CoA ligase [Acidimicrobiia bacterium]